LRLLSRGPLFSPARWASIWRINTGQLDELIDRDAYRFPDLLELDLWKAVSPPAGGYSFNDSGVEIRLDAVSQARYTMIEVDSQADFEVLYLRGDRTIATQTVTAAFTAGDTTRHKLVIPNKAAQQGFDRIRILPLRGMKEYHLVSFEIQ
jgi:hypothetical protein